MAGRCRCPRLASWDVNEPQPETGSATPTPRERVASAQGEAKARGWIAAARIVVDGEVVTDPNRPTPPGDRWYISGG